MIDTSKIRRNPVGIDERSTPIDLIRHGFCSLDVANIARKSATMTAIISKYRLSRWTEIGGTVKTADWVVHPDQEQAVHDALTAAGISHSMTGTYARRLHVSGFAHQLLPMEWHKRDAMLADANGGRTK